MQPRRLIDQKDRIVDERFLVEFRKEHFANHLYSGRKQADVKRTGVCGIDGGGQPVSVVIELDSRIIDLNVLLVCTAVFR